eukprot:m.77992 g.77992  ORF g.77992 m.77992 type:complete len:58 (-) comp8558_c0_seq1:53-226(-)
MFVCEKLLCDGESVNLFFFFFHDSFMVASFFHVYFYYIILLYVFDLSLSDAFVPFSL